MVAQQYPPDELVGQDYYLPSQRGDERAVSERLAGYERHPGQMGALTGRVEGSAQTYLDRREGRRVPAGEIAGLIAAGAFVLLVLLLAIPLLKLGKTLDEATLTIRQTHEAAAPLLGGAQSHRAMSTASSSRSRHHPRGRLDDQQRGGADLDRVLHGRQPADQGGRVLLRGAPGAR